MSPKPPFSITTVSKEGGVVTGFDASRPMNPREEKIVEKEMLRLPGFIQACVNLMADREANLAILNSTKKKLGGKWS